MYGGAGGEAEGPGVLHLSCCGLYQGSTKRNKSKWNQSISDKIHRRRMAEQNILEKSNDWVLRTGGADGVQARSPNVVHFGADLEVKGDVIRWPAESGISIWPRVIGAESLDARQGEHETLAPGATGAVT